MSDSRDPRMNEAMEDVRELQESAAASFFALEDALPDATPTPPTAPPRERESEAAFIVRVMTESGTTEGEVGAARANIAMRYNELKRAGYDFTRAATVARTEWLTQRLMSRLAAASLPPSAGTREPEPDFYTERGAAERDALAEVLRFANGSGGWSAVVEAIRAAPPSAGSVGTEDAAMLEELAELYERKARHNAKTPGLDGLVERQRKVASALRRTLARLAVHPAGPTSAGSGETGRAYRELDEAMTMIDEQRGGIEGMRRNARIARQVIRTLAAHPAGTTREEG